MRRLAFLLALLSVLPAGAEPLGRLFFTPAQRAVLDAARLQDRATDVPPPAARVILNGVVTRSDGGATVWINNQPHAGGDGPPGVTVDATGQVGVKSAAGRTVRLKVGQSLDPGSGKVDEAYRRPRPAGEKAPGGQ